MNLVKISLQAEGYYSGQTYEETIFLLEDDYKLLEQDVTKFEIYIGELDGKHSEVKGYITLTIINEKEQENYNFEVENDSDYLYDGLHDVTNDLDKLIDKAEDYISTIDSMTTITFNVRKSKVEELKRMVNEFIETK